MKIKVLNIATILPFPEGKNGYKLIENDFLIVLNKYLEKLGLDTEFVKVTNSSNKLLSKFNEKWAYYYNMPNEYYIEGNRICVIRQIMFPKSKLSTLSFVLSILLKKSKFRALGNKNYTCTHAHFLLLDGYISYYLYKKYNIPYVLTVRDETNIFNKLILRTIGQRILNNASVLLTTNVVNKNKLEKFTNKDIKIITHGIEQNNLHFYPDVNKKIRITTVCKLNPGKKIDILINALKNIKDKDYILNIIGDGPEYDYLKSIAHGVKCNFLGNLKHNEVIEHLKASDIFVLPSESESFGRVYIEALASSNAVIAVEDTGVYGLFEHDKEILYMKKNSTESLQELLTILLNDQNKIRSLKINGYKSIIKDFTWESIAEKYYYIYTSLLKV
ncbi:glycosyltransferase family 4 protein [Radiobacillus sp. PE A8.2]|uniref:glycosyltransferase family 4 protein n=1 Tax=Radiobacillus sp. PE A8.2 TaxID=3380349 RepID=UPI00388E4CF9